MLDELEDFLIQSDVGVESAKELREKLGKNSRKMVEEFHIFPKNRKDKLHGSG